MCVWLPCCLPSPVPPQPPAPGKKFKTISRTAAATTGSPAHRLSREKARPGESWELLRGAAVDWVLKVTTAIQRDGGRVTLTKDLTFKAGTLKLK